jgi:NAD(P)-dependent dehydrogenase (short-subunit alcohol dehydrogenase family)
MEAAGFDGTRRFAGKVVLVTGAGHGIGLAIAERFHAEGAKVAINDISPERVSEVLERHASPRLMAVPADVSQSGQVDAMVSAVEQQFGPVDVLVNNAGLIYADRHFFAGDEAWWDKVLGVNLKGSFLCAQRVARSMAKRHTGIILNMSSGGATKAHRGNVAYDASKGGIEAMTRAMALDLAPYGIRVNALVPGFIRTYDLTDEQAVERGQSVPLGRMGVAEDLAGSAAFLASEDAAYITGICLPIDGGVLVQQRSVPVDTFPLSRFPKVEDL